VRVSLHQCTQRVMTCDLAATVPLLEGCETSQWVTGRQGKDVTGKAQEQCWVAGRSRWKLEFGGSAEPARVKGVRQGV
jgi:hypothetical protein